MIYGYCRVSSRSQLDNNSLELQEREITQRYEGAVIYKEQISGIKSHRPVFNEIIGKLKKGDTLVTTRLDRLCRSTKEGLEVIKNLQEKEINIHILNMGLIENSPMGDLIITCILAFSQFERSMIVERTSAGKELAKINDDYREGRPKKFTKKQISHALKLLEKHSYKEVGLMTGISKSTLIRAKRQCASVEK
ncbi:DNA-invertase hin (plasmid) [Terrisporobacter petrolearius]|uniref:Recombinase family protein n=1 Tax=Terrisporobacter hibernicus TaxID=2813371 RepID=A0AAX2ZLM4_9FIRM|nr:MULTISPECIES: recombinase family protein [Clostridia]MDU4843945.1 recombinase family protein [Leclercia adecarboxylata]MDU7089454.1 recombinase family protein [Clostridium sp.]UEL49876.1 recombinase family protein [Terrisporobacter hibernicus]